MKLLSKTFQVVLSFSPVGSVLRVRARRFPAIINCTSIDWFHSWPQKALLSVSDRFLQNIPQLRDAPSPASSRKKSSPRSPGAETAVDESGSPVERELGRALDKNHPVPSRASSVASDAEKEAIDEVTKESRNESPKQNNEENEEKCEEEEKKEKKTKIVKSITNPTAVRSSVSQFMAYVHTSVNQISKSYFHVRVSQMSFEGFRFRNIFIQI